MAIYINDVWYRNLPEQVAKNVAEIGELNAKIEELPVIDTYSKSQIDSKDLSTLNSAKDYTDGQITALSNTYYTKSQVDNLIPVVPTNVSAFTNDAGYIAGITSSMVTTALGYTPGTSNFSGSYTDLTDKPTIPDAVSGTNDGTNWTTLTIGNSTYGLAGGSGSGTMYTHTVRMVRTVNSSTDLTITIQFNNFNNTQITSYSAFMTAFANHSIPEVILGTGWSKNAGTGDVNMLDRVVIKPANDRVEIQFINQAQIFTPISFYLEASSTGYTITDTVSPITA